MTEPKDLLILVEQLRRSNRRWKTLALAVCAVLVLVACFSIVAATRARRQVEAEMQAANAARVRAAEALARANATLKENNPVAALTKQVETASTKQVETAEARMIENLERNFERLDRHLRANLRADDLFSPISGAMMKALMEHHKNVVNWIREGEPEKAKDHVDEIHELINSLSTTRTYPYWSYKKEAVEYWKSLYPGKPPENVDKRYGTIWK
jgi:hypothetical protein